MAWISFVCLLALSSSAFARSAYDSYSSAPLSRTILRDSLPTETNYGYSESVQRDIPVEKPVVESYGSYGSRKIQADQSYGKPMIQSRVFPTQQELLLAQQDLLAKKVAESEIPTEANLLCRGQRAETIIPLDGNRRFIVCQGEGKGQEQVCPTGLLFHPEARRCERKLGPLDNPCASSPCLNNGQCIPTDGSYKCQCAAGFDGRICELDATVCETQRPCGALSGDSKCQSFRWGAALTHMCVFQQGRSYGLTSGQTFPSPCKGIDGTFPLAFSDKGFVMCDGEYTFYESCPGGTMWDDMNKACVWPDLNNVVGPSFDEMPKTLSYGSYGSSYSAPALEQPRHIQTFRDAPIKSSYSSPMTHKFEDLPVKSSYSSPMTHKFEDLPVKSSYSSPMTHKFEDLSVKSSYSSPMTHKFEDLPVNNGYGAKSEITHLQHDRVVEPVSYSSYSAPETIKPKFIQSIRQNDIRMSSNGY